MRNRAGRVFGAPYKWINLMGLMVVYGSLCGNITYGYGVFLPTMSEHFHWSRSAVSGPYMLFCIVGGLLGPMAGTAVSRFGARRNMLFCNLLAVAGLFGMSKVTTLWQTYFWFGAVMGVVIAFGEFIPITTVINNWFVSRRSVAMGLLFAAGGIGGFVMPPVIGGLIMARGWQQAWAWMAGLHLLLAVGFGGMIVLMPQLYCDYFGRRHYARILGWTLPAVTLASSAGPVLAGALYDATGKYNMPMAITLATIVAGIVVSFCMPAYSKRRSGADEHGLGRICAAGSGCLAAGPCEDAPGTGRADLPEDGRIWRDVPER
jgi:MFS family permease